MGLSAIDRASVVARACRRIAIPVCSDLVEKGSTPSDGRCEIQSVRAWEIPATKSRSLHAISAHRMRFVLATGVFRVGLNFEPVISASPHHVMLESSHQGPQPQDQSAALARQD